MKERTSKPYYRIDQETKNIIIQLKEKCIELSLGNVGFHYYPTKATMDDIDFYLAEYRHYWELVVKQRWAKTADIYRVKGSVLDYQYSERD